MNGDIFLWLCIHDDGVLVMNLVCIMIPRPSGYHMPYPAPLQHIYTPSSIRDHVLPYTATGEMVPGLACSLPGGRSHGSSAHEWEFCCIGTAKEFWKML